mgnify:CR=1 FL=1
MDRNLSKENLNKHDKWKIHKWNNDERTYRKASQQWICSSAFQLYSKFGVYKKYYGEYNNTERWRDYTYK